MSSAAAPNDSHSSESHAGIKKLEEELIKLQKREKCAAWKNSRMHQGIIIVSLISSVAAASMAAFSWEPEWRWVVSFLAAIPALGVALSQQLHCVEAANINRRREQLARSLLIKLRYEHAAVPEIGKELRTGEEKLTLLWEQVTLAGLRSSHAEPEGRPDELH